MFLDENGNIVQKNLDGGDTAQRTGFLEVALRIRDNLKLNAALPDLNGWNFQKQWPTLFKDKKLIRNPRDWNDPKDTSRDQSSCMIMAFGLNKLAEQIEWVSPKGFLLKFFPNGDLSSPENNGIVKRAHGQNPSWLADHWAEFGILSRIVQSENKPDDVGDDLNCLASAVFSVHVLPTKKSRENLHFYLRERPFNYGNTKLGEHCPVMGALKWYFREETGGNPELAEVWRPIVEFYRTVLEVPVL